MTLYFIAPKQVITASENSESKGLNTLKKQSYGRNPPIEW